MGSRPSLLCYIARHRITVNVMLRNITQRMRVAWRQFRLQAIRISTWNKLRWTQRRPVLRCGWSHWKWEYVQPELKAFAFYHEFLGSSCFLTAWRAEKCFVTVEEYAEHGKVLCTTSVNWTRVKIAYADPWSRSLWKCCRVCERYWQTLFKKYISSFFYCTNVNIIR
jgi:hypothetical protein